MLDNRTSTSQHIPDRNDSSQALNEIAEVIMIGAHHDSIPSTSIQEVHDSELRMFN
jgi:hypothetical protein